MNFPSPFVPNPLSRAGRMMQAGRAKVTVTSRKSGDHITVLLKAFADNRKRQYSDVKKNWVACPLEDATHVFCEVPAAGDGWNDKVGTYYPKTGRWFDADGADPARVWAVQAAAHWLIYEPEATDLADFQESSECGRCGRELTDPVSIERGIGPECYGKLTGSQHQVKEAPVQQEQITLADLKEEKRGADARAYITDSNDRTFMAR